jgi:hypothetical protein
MPNSSVNLNEIPEDVQWIYFDHPDFQEQCCSEPSAEIDLREYESATPILTSRLPLTVQVVEAPVVYLDQLRDGLTVNCETLIAPNDEALGSIAKDSHWEHLWLCGSLRQSRPEHQLPARLLPPIQEALPAERRITTETLGFSMWHLLALNCLKPSEAAEFLTEAKPVDPAILRADLWESTSESPRALHLYLVKSETTYGQTWPSSILASLLGYRTPLEMTAVAGRPFLEAYAADLDLDALLTPALKEFMAWSEALHRKIQPLTKQQ